MTFVRKHQSGYGRNVWKTRIRQ